MKRLLAGALIVALAIGVAWPAAGASPASLAKKALKAATKAGKTASAARSAAAQAKTTADQASTTAGQANATAGQALTAAQQGPPTVHVDSGNVDAAPHDFARFDVKCPAGYAPSGFGPGLGALELVAALPTPDGYLGSYFNPSNSTTYHGNLTVVCVHATWQGTAKRLSDAAAKSQQRRLEQARLAR
jgi:hypothetical protein